MKECHEKSPVMNIILPETNESFKKDKYKEEIKLLSDNSSHLVKLNIINVPRIDKHGLLFACELQFLYHGPMSMILYVPPRVI